MKHGCGFRKCLKDNLDGHCTHRTNGVCYRVVTMWIIGIKPAAAALLQSKYA